MARGRRIAKRIVAPDPIYKNEIIAKFINFVMKDGKKTVAQTIVYGAIDALAKKQEGGAKEDGVKVFERAIETVRPQVEVRSRRVGGANYQIPTPVTGRRQDTLAFRWIVTAAKARRGSSMGMKLAAEMMDALEGTGGALKKKEDVHRMAEANKAFAHFARRRS